MPVDARGSRPALAIAIGRSPSWAGARNGGRRRSATAADPGLAREGCVDRGLRGLDHLVGAEGLVLDLLGEGILERLLDVAVVLHEPGARLGELGLGDEDVLALRRRHVRAGR